MSAWKKWCCILVPRLWYNVLSHMDFVLNFSWSFRKNWRKLFMAFQCLDFDGMFCPYIDFVLDFSCSFRKNCRKSFMAFKCLDCDTMFCPTLILFSTFHKASEKTGENIHAIPMPRLWYNVVFLHWFYSWLFMKLQKKLKKIFYAIPMPRL